MTEEQKNKLKKSFGISGGNDKSDLGGMGATQKQRPYTQETKGTTTPTSGQEPIEINTKSRRRSNKAQTDMLTSFGNTRPGTSPGFFNKHDIDDGKSQKSQITDWGGSHTPHGQADDDDDGALSQNDYFSQAANRRKTDQLKPPVNPQSRLRIDVHSDAGGRDNTPKRSPASNIGGEGYFPDERKGSAPNTGKAGGADSEFVPNLEKASRRSRRGDTKKFDEVGS